jgi:hypothetical protein
MMHYHKISSCFYRYFVAKLTEGQFIAETGTEESTFLKGLYNNQ